MKSFLLPRQISSGSKNTLYYQRLDNYYENDSVPLLHEKSINPETRNESTISDVIGMYQDGTMLYDNACVLDVSNYLNYGHKQQNKQRKRRIEKPIGQYNVQQNNEGYSSNWQRQLNSLICCSQQGKSNDHEKLYNNNNNNNNTDTNQPLFTFDFTTIDNISTTFDHSSISSHGTNNNDENNDTALEYLEMEQQQPYEEEQQFQEPEQQLPEQQTLVEQQNPQEIPNEVEPRILQQPMANDYVTRSDGTNLEDALNILPIGYVTVVKKDNNNNKNSDDNEEKYKSYFENDEDDEEEDYNEDDNKKIDYYESFHTSLTSYNTTISSTTSSTHSHSSGSSSDSSTSSNSSTSSSSTSDNYKAHNDQKENQPVATTTKKKVGWFDEATATSSSPPPLHSGISSLPTRYTPLVTKILVAKRSNNLQSVRIEM